MSWEWEARASLREGGHNATNCSSNVGSNIEHHFDGNKHAFVVVNIKASGFGEVIKELFKVSSMLWDRPINDKSVIGILKNRALHIINKRVEELPVREASRRSCCRISATMLKRKGERGHLDVGRAGIESSARGCNQI
jgi:hypothetical protein